MQQTVKHIQLIDKKYKACFSAMVLDWIPAVSESLSHWVTQRTYRFTWTIRVVSKNCCLNTMQYYVPLNSEPVQCNWLLWYNLEGNRPVQQLGKQQFNFGTTILSMKRYLKELISGSRTAKSTVLYKNKGSSLFAEHLTCTLRPRAF